LRSHTVHLIVFAGDVSLNRGWRRLLILLETIKSESEFARYLKKHEEKKLEMA